MNVQRGDVVMVDWLYSDRTGSKRRPALVVQADAYNQTLDDTILVMIASSSRRRIGAATQMDVDSATADGQRTGLIFNSAVQRHVLSVFSRCLDALRLCGRAADGQS